MTGEGSMVRVDLGAVADKDDKESVERVKKATHDRLVEDLGDKRRSGVVWYLYDSPEAVKIIDDLGFGDEAQGLRDFLTSNLDGLLVVASADCVADGKRYGRRRETASQRKRRKRAGAAA